MFDKLKFETGFNASIKALAKSENVTKAELLTLSRSVLEAHHATGDVAYINRLLGVLTPMNKKTAVLYFKEFSGFNLEGQTFTTKNKKKYDACQAACIKFLEDPLNNLWTWADRNIEIAAKPFDAKQLQKSAETLLKKAKDAELSQVQVLEAFMEAGLTLDAILSLMKKIEGIEVDVK